MGVREMTPADYKPVPQINDTCTGTETRLDVQEYAKRKAAQ
jgi:hypothetical protein